jgi:hypothetical protein
MQPPFISVLTRARRALALCALAGSIVVVLSACGSSGSTAAATAGNTSSTTSSSTRYQARLKFAQCMRSHGVQVPDPSANGAPGGGFGGGGGGGFGAIRQALGTATGKAALQACASLRSKSFGFANITPAQRQTFQQDAIKFAECMRAHSIDIPDPTSNGSGGFGIFRSISPSQRNSPAFQTAMKACSTDLPFRRGGPGGFGGGAGSTVGGPGA